MVLKQSTNEQATLVDRESRTAGLQKLYWYHVAVLSVVAVAIWCFYPEWRWLLVEESAVVELCSAGFSFFGFCVGLFAILFLMRGSIRWIHAPIPLLALLAFLDEIELGIPYMGLQKPLLFGYEFDGIHDFVSIGFKLLREKGTIVHYVFVSICIGSGAGAAFLYRKRYMPWVMKTVRLYPAYDFVRYAVVLIGCGMILDLDIINRPEAVLGEELLETFGTLALLFASICMCLTGRGRSCPDTPMSS